MVSIETRVDVKARTGRSKPRLLNVRRQNKDFYVAASACYLSVYENHSSETIEMKPWLAHDQDPSLQCCRTLHVKHAAYASALYTLNISILLVLLYSWRIGVNAKRYRELDDVYYGVQIAYFAIIGTQIFMMMLSFFLFYGIYKENVSFLVPWVLGCITLMALETMALVYCNVLRDHVNKQFDAICKAEISLLILRIVLNCVCIRCVLRLYHLLRAGVTWRGAAPITL